MYGIDPDDLEYCEKHDNNYMWGEECLYCNPWFHKKPQIGDKVTMRNIAFVGVVASTEDKYGWYEIEIDGKPFGKFKEVELKPWRLK